MTRSSVLLILVSFLTATLVQGEHNELALPRVAGVEVPLYPPLARASHVEGVIRLHVSTDGHRVIAIQIEAGHKLLAEAASENVRTWSFSVHQPTSFVVSFRYKLLPVSGDARAENPTIVLRLPTEIDISIPRLPPLD